MTEQVKNAGALPAAPLSAGTKNVFVLLASCLLAALCVAGCASSDRMARMSGGVIDEYSAPKSSRIRSEKYQKVSKKLDAGSRANRDRVSGLNDTLVNFWPFFFRSSDYWSALWPMIDSDPYGFAIRPFYNHEGDEYSILFPLTAWNPAAGDGWVTLFAWNRNAFGFLPLTWQWSGEHEGGGYYTPLCIWSCDRSKSHRYANWPKDDFKLFLFPVLWGHETSMESGEWSWLFSSYDYPGIKNEWLYRFAGKKPFPASREEFVRFRTEILDQLPRNERRLRGIIPLWWGSTEDNGDYDHRFLLLAGCERNGGGSNWDVLGPVLARYSSENHSKVSHWSTVEESSFTSCVLMSHFSSERSRSRDEMWKKLNDFEAFGYGSKPFGQKLPAIRDALKKLDPSKELPETVVDDVTFRLFVSDLRKQYRFSETTDRFGTVAPLFWYDITPDHSSWVLPPLLTWWRSAGEHGDGYFYSLPLLTFIDRSPEEDTSIIFTPLGYYAKTVRRERRDYPIFDARKNASPGENEYVELRDRYAVCGLFYRGRFGYNAAKPGVNAAAAERLRGALRKLPGEWRYLERRRAELDKQSSVNDRWQTGSEIERLKKLIRVEEIRIDRKKLADQVALYREKVDCALDDAGVLGLKFKAETFADDAAAREAADELIDKCTDLCYYEDIGNGLLFHKEKFANGDSRWKLLGFLAGGEKTGGRESTHILHLLYRSRREGSRSERVYFPFIVDRQDGEDSSFSFMWRVFALNRRNGRTSGHILFIPFGEE